MRHSTSTTLGRLVGALLVTSIKVAAESSERNSAFMAEREEAARWERRRTTVFDTIDRALMADHSRHYVSNASKSRQAARLRDDATQHSQRRSEALMRMTEEQASRFERYGTC